MEFRKSANPLIEQFLEEAIKKTDNPVLCNHFKKALRELRKFPLPLASGRDCIIIRGFGRKLCKLVDEWLIRKKAQMCLEVEKKSDEKQTSSNLQVKQKEEKVETTFKKVDIIEISSSSEDEFDENFCIENAEPVITVSKKKSNFIFTSEEAAEKKTVLLEGCSQEEEQFFLLPNNIDIILLIDKQETCGGKTKPQDDETISEITKSGVLFEVRSLKVGDFAWIARCRLTNRELILPYIVERKASEDLSASIKDGRYHEQKFRLTQCGIKKVIYLIESSNTTYRGSIPLSSLLQAGINSFVQDNFDVKYSKNHKDSMHYLAELTSLFTELYEGKELISCKKLELIEKNSCNSNKFSEYLMVFDQFNKAAAKQKKFTVQQLLIRQIIKLNGISAEKAAAIANRYSTPRALVQAAEVGGENFLTDISVGPIKKIGPIISRTIYQYYSKLNLD